MYMYMYLPVGVKKFCYSENTVHVPVNEVYHISTQTYTRNNY